MKVNRLSRLAVLLAWGVLACKGKEAQAPSQAGSATSASPASPGQGSAAAPPPAPVRPAVEQLAPAIDLKAPPADAVKLPSGMVFKRLTTTSGAMPGKNDTIEVHFTGWKVATGETFNTTRTRGVPMPLDLAGAGPGFAEVFTQVHLGEKVMMWMPAELVGGGTKGAAEALAFEAELVKIDPAPAVPADVAAPPAAAKATRGGLRTLVLTPGTGADRARAFDTVAFHYTMWDASGRMLASTEKRARPVSSVLFRQPRALEDAVTGLVTGQRIRFWVDASKLEQLDQMVKVAGPPPKGLLCFELQLVELTKGNPPPPTPRDVKAPPAGVQKTASGVSYRVLRPGKGTTHATATDRVRVHYTGWTTDGHIFDSSVVRGEPASFPLSGVIRGWTDGIPTMVVGEQTRFWIPQDLAYKGVDGQPKGMLVFDVELLEILPATEAPDPHGGSPHDHGH